MKSLHGISFVLVVIGGLNWLLVGLFSFDVVAWILGDASILSRIVYVLVGLSAILMIFANKKKEVSASPAPQM